MSGAERKTIEASPEERFFGTRTTIEDLDLTEEQPPEIVVEADDGDTKPAAQEGASSADLEDYSGRVQKRIDQLTWEKNEEKRQREEAINFAKQILKRNQTLETTINQGEGYLIDRVKRSAELSLNTAREKFKRAQEEGDTDKIIAAQEEWIKAQAEQEAALRQEQDYNFRRQQWQQHMQMQRMRPPPQQVPQQQPAVRQVSERTKDWGSKNPWFGDPKYPEMTSLAYGLHERMVRVDGIQPDTDEYYSRLDAGLRQHFPDYFGDDDGYTGSSRRTPSTPVAPATRESGRNRRTVKLSATERQIAKQLGLSDEQYAEQKALEMEKSHG